MKSVKFPNFISTFVKDFSLLSFKSPWYSRTSVTGRNPCWQRSTGKSGSVSLSQHASVILTTWKPTTGTLRTVLLLRASAANKVCVWRSWALVELTHTVVRRVGLGRHSQGSHCNYTSQSPWSVARLTSSDYTASAKGAEEAGGWQVVVGEEG